MIPNCFPIFILLVRKILMGDLFGWSSKFEFNPFCSHTRPNFLDVEYDNFSRVDGSKRWDPERWHAGTKAQHLKARREAAAKENAAQRSINAPVVGETNSWRKTKNDKRSGLAMDEEAENGKNDETFGATRLGPQRRR